MSCHRVCHILLIIVIIYVINANMISQFERIINYEIIFRQLLSCLGNRIANMKSSSLLNVFKKKNRRRIFIIPLVSYYEANEILKNQDIFSFSKRLIFISIHFLFTFSRSNQILYSSRAILSSFIQAYNTIRLFLHFKSSLIPNKIQQQQ